MSGRCRISAQPFPRRVPGTGAAGHGFTYALCPRHPRRGRTSSHTLQHMIEISPFWSAAHGIMLDRVPGVVSLLEKKSHAKDTCPVLCSNRHSNRSSRVPFTSPGGSPCPAVTTAPLGASLRMARPVGSGSFHANQWKAKFGRTHTVYSPSPANRVFLRSLITP